MGQIQCCQNDKDDQYELSKKTRSSDKLKRKDSPKEKKKDKKTEKKKEKSELEDGLDSAKKKMKVFGTMIKHAM